ncbi:hypothetical protein SAMN04487765_3630 [Tenacibaculum sp. MAR_2010_89]|uniref:hypothetical protein n=1 Tax=Tenacibaculum sp. MAR_2010_89 TaxID=1250198 RepID=UPI0008974FE4|nr:hypothetical protein [Tenacibaculum sp. MAR_2010_89]SEE65624.1 hypothetical protein SAMN04487765_3630 [Tenacibaculum sp. MAR_2010_89]
MRTGILFLLTIMFLTPLSANNINKSTSKIGVTYRYDDAVTFVERNVQFHVFLNGEFDFNTHYRDTKYVDYYGRRTKTNRGVRIDRDFKGRIRRIGNVFVNYDYRGNVTRIGSVFIRYRRGQLTKVGNLRVRYDRWGNPFYKGDVKSQRYYNEYESCDDRFSIDINIGDVFDYDNAYFYRRDFRNNYRQFKEDNNFFYYRAKPNARIGKRSKVLKRRKSKRNSDNYYFKKPTTKQKIKSRRNK